MDIYKAGDSFKAGSVNGNDIYAAGNSFRVGSVKGDDIYAGGGKFPIGSVKGDDIYAAGNSFRAGYVKGDDIYAGGNFPIGSVKGGGTNAQKGAAGLLILGYFDQKSGGGEQPVIPPSGGEQPVIPPSGGNEKPNPLWVFVIHPVGNIVLGLLIAIGLTIFSGGGSFAAGVIMSGKIPLVLGIIVTVIGVLRLFLGGKERK
jgi:hypothetical protein